MRLHHKIAGAALAAGLFTGMLAGSVAPAGAGTLPLLSTTTSVVSSTVPGSGHNTLTATVTLQLVTGTLISPSGTVVFTGYNNVGGYNFGSGTLTRCLLGLPGLLGLWTESCTATAAPTAAEQSVLNCSNLNIEASYTAATDLLAKPSAGFTKSPAVC